MLGTNKSGSTERLSTGSYSSYLASVDFRSEPRIKDTAETFALKQFHVTNRFYCDAYDIVPSDRIVYNGKNYVVMSAQVYDDRLGEHIEGFMREIDSYIHDEIIIEVRENNQNNWDPILKEYVGSIQVTETTIKVLIDPIAQSKKEFIKIIDAGKLEDIDYVMQVDLPQTFNLSDKLEYNGTKYSIAWRYDRPYDRIFGLKKEIKNYKS